MRRIAVGLCILITTTLVASRHKELPTDFPLPSDYSLDFQIASAQRAKLSITTVKGTEINRVSDKVFQNLLGTTMISSYSLPYRWQLAVSNDGTVNAGSLPDGEIVVHGGLASLIRTDPGLWAAVLSHEISHTAHRHAVKKYQYEVFVAREKAYWRARAAAGDKSANWALLAVDIAAPIGEKKLSRDLEHDADISGMMLMARAGYHPDNVFALHHLLRMYTGDQSKMAAFFSDHPRWETRDQREERAYADALTEYQRLWPDPAKSPGGPPPAVAFVGRPESREDKQTGAARITVPVYCRNEPQAVSVRLLFSPDKHVPRVTEVAAGNAGTFAMQGSYTCNDRQDAVPFYAAVPGSSIPSGERHLKARALVVDGEGNLLEESTEFDVHLPKGSIGTTGSAAPVLASISLQPVHMRTRETIESNVSTMSGVGGKDTQPPPAAVASLPENEADLKPVTTEPAHSEVISTRATSGEVMALRGNREEEVVSAIPPYTPKTPNTPETPKPVSQDGEVRFRSNPEGASVEVDGQYAGVTPMTMKLATGDHTIVFRKRDFATFKTNVQVTHYGLSVSGSMQRTRLTLR